jgi:hypothetical protein
MRSDYGERIDKKTGMYPVGRYITGPVVCRRWASSNGIPMK